MALKYYNSSKSIRTTIPKETYKEDFIAISEQIFDNTDNVYYDEIFYEEHYGQKDFVSIPMVRVDSVVNYNTGIQVGDDYKVFIFKPDFPVIPYYGMKFKWGDNYWLCVNTNNLGGLSISAEVRRCNNTLRFFDENGNKIYEPCILDQVLRFTNNNDTMTIVTGKAEQYIWCQRNDVTKIIKPNDRFLFGVPEQRIGFRVYAGGFGNSLNTVTADNNSPSITQFYVEEYEMNYELDDIIGGFANAERYNYRIDISENSTLFDVDTEYQLSAVIYKGEDKIDKNILWKIVGEEDNIVSIDGNILKALNQGNVQICAYMEENEAIKAILSIIVQEEQIEEEYDIHISPDIDYILEKETLNAEVALYKNGVIQDVDIIIQNVTNNVPINNYKVVVHNNSFSITNYKKYLYEPLIIKCSYNGVEKEFEFTLRGLY